MPAVVDSQNVAFQTVRPTENGYFVAHAEEEIPLSHRPGKRGGAVSNSMCCQQPGPMKASVTAMAHIGQGAGDYVLETRYKYVGKGAGQFTLVEPVPPAQPIKLTSFLPLLLVLVLILVVCGWLLIPEATWRAPHPTKPLQHAALPATETTVVPAHVLLSMSMKVSNINWELLQKSNQAQLLSRFFTEISSGIALTAGHGLLPDNVTVSLQPGSDIIHAIIHPPRMVNSRQLRSSIAASTDRIAEGVLTSVEMMRGIEAIARGKIGVSEVDVQMVADSSGQATPGGVMKVADPSGQGQSRSLRWVASGAAPRQEPSANDFGRSLHPTQVERA